jgi:hypothetical protein
MWRNLTGGLVLALLTAAPAAAQNPADPFRKVDPITLPLDKGQVWTLHFAYLPVRITEVTTADGKTHRAWYMVYRVWNTHDTPVQFVPEFELVTKDGELRTFLDEPQPLALEQIRRREDPTGELKLKSSIGIMKEKIPVTKVDSIPRAVYGVAIWMDAPDKAASTNNFSVYVGGLSNGVAVSEKDGGPETITRKTLQIDFVRPTNAVNPRLNDVRVNENAGLGAEKWIYRAIPVQKPAAAPEKKENGK